MKGLLHYRGLRGELELLPEGAVEREAAEKDERIYRLSDLDDLLAELRASKVDSGPGLAIQEVGALLISRALAAT